ncbi:MAG: hypothetical protein P4L36_18005 [Holophaga sp.]|nr:hypothetical protein [Holophaga sp.]
MKVCTTVFAALVLVGPGALIQAQTPVPPKTAAKPATSTKGKESLEAQFARQNFKQVLDAVNDAWFGKPYAGVNAVDLQGTMTINLTAAAMNAKVDAIGQGAVKGDLTKGATVNLKLKGTYFANADFRTELTGEFGNLLYYRVGNKGFLYSKEQNAWTSRIDPPPVDAPTSFLGWFRQCVNEIQTVYVDGSSFKATLGKESAAGGSTMQTLLFSSPTGPYDAKKREQSMAESLGFWKRGKLEVVFDKASHLPHQMNYSNDSQGIFTHMTFSYNPGGKLNSVTIANQSKGMEGPASISLGYDGGGLINHLTGQMGFTQGTMRFDLDMAFAKGRKTSSIVTVPPPTATKKGREEMETMLLVNLAGKVLDLQRSGFNLRSVTLGNN